MTDQIKKVLPQFQLPEEFQKITLFNNGHINKTYKVTYEKDGKDQSYIVQGINSYVFKNPEDVMDNIAEITQFMKQKLEACGGDSERGVLNFLKTDSGKNYYQDENGEYWRVYRFVDHSKTYDVITDTRILYNSGKAFGDFQQMLSDFPMEKLKETIPGFHDTPERLKYFDAMVKKDPLGRAKDAQQEIAFIQSHAEMAERLIRMQRTGELPLRVTHNDTKFNNVLIDTDTDEAICVIDLDTVMPGLCAYDFGDAVRFAASSAAEDEVDLSKVYLDMDYYEAFTKGYMESAGKHLTQNEIETMALGALTITLELASRFLADHIDGDHYFHIHHENHNLERAKNQLKLVADMEAKYPLMCEIVKKYA